MYLIENNVSMPEKTKHFTEEKQHQRQLVNILGIIGNSLRGI